MGCCCIKAKVTDSFHEMKDDGPSDSESSDSEGGENKFECPICFGTSTKRLYATPCAHVFHAKCLLRWAQRNPDNPVCPTCRHKLVM
jgi:hypothetical protein